VAAFDVVESIVLVAFKFLDVGSILGVGYVHFSVEGLDCVCDSLYFRSEVAYDISGRL
jgi:hypothetical protein